MKLLVSACLMGLCTRYDGECQENPQVLALAERHCLIPVCPEQLGGMPTPRPASEIRGSRVINRLGVDVTSFFYRGAEQALQVFRLCGCEAAVLKRRSPSCGKGQVYNGEFAGQLTQGDGVSAALLKANGISVYGEDETHLIE
ncbi:MAG: DUF523 domain-containing protein [Christensenellales bacterium]|jgi:uncharacterized protein YbbK (DUF523 family)